MPVQYSDICVASGTYKKAIDSIRKDIARQNSVFSDKRYLDTCSYDVSILVLMD